MQKAVGSLWTVVEAEARHTDTRNGGTVVAKPSPHAVIDWEYE